MKAILKNNLSFLIPYIIFLALGGFMLALISKADIQIGFNQYHHPFFDTFFYYLTNFGEGVIVTLVFIMLLAIKFRLAIIVGLSNIISALIAQLLKHTLFADAVRPKKFFEGVYDLYFVPGVDNHLFFSFPSGHTTCAFSLYFALALIVKKKTYKLALFILALSIGYSRIYLSQHFFEDVYAGSLIGVSTALMVFYFIQKTNKHWMEQSLVNVFRN